MVKKIIAEEIKDKMILGGAKTFDKVLYLYLSPDKKYLLYSNSAVALLNHPEVKKPLTLSPKGISFFLQSGVIPTPYSIYEEVFNLSIGDYVVIYSKNGRLEFEFFHEFPYPSFKRIKGKKADLDYILSLLVESIFKKIDPVKEIFLFQSVGKDSNTILLALAEAGLKNQTTALTLALPGSKKDESELASEIAKKLGFKHVKLYLPERITSIEIDILEKYFSSIPFPCADGNLLAYPMYQLQINFSGSNLLDGSGNDYYFGHVPRPIEYKRQKIYPKFKFLRPLGETLPSGNTIHRLARSRCEMVGFIGITLADLLKFYPQAEPIYPYWFSEDEKRKDWDYFDLKADVWVTHAEFGNVIRKVSNFTDTFGVNLVLPWADEALADYIGSLDESEVLDRKNFRNKLPLRRLLLERLEIDSDKIGKFSYGFPILSFFEMMKDKVKEEVLNCKLWERKGVERFWKVLEERAKKDKIWQKIYGRLFFLSAFINHSKYLNSKES
jgi:asparagine synthase (glutamine-hydrolysing)